MFMMTTYTGVATFLVDGQIIHVISSLWKDDIKVIAKEEMTEEHSLFDCR